MRNRRFLEYYLEADKQRQKQLLKQANKDQIDSISEVALNLLKKNIPVNPQTKARLAKHKKDITYIASKGPRAKRKKILVQRGGSFLPLVLSAVLPLILKQLNG